MLLNFKDSPADRPMTITSSLAQKRHFDVHMQSKITNVLVRKQNCGGVIRVKLKGKKYIYAHYKGDLK